LASRSGQRFTATPGNKDPVAIAKSGIAEAKSKGCNVVIIDTAGRLAVDQEMMTEIANIHKAIQPQETLFVVDSMTGQDAVNTAKAFNDILNFDGVILTKLDGDTRGGAAISIKSVVNKPYKIYWYRRENGCHRLFSTPPEWQTVF
jgi:signal recognition particle subunit SRP54